MTTCTIARGYEYGEDYLSSVVDCDDELDARAFVAAVVSNFDAAARGELGAHVSLLPGTSEVYGDAAAEYPWNVDDILGDCLELAKDAAMIAVGG
ncbi:MAG: hypothetical protein GY851_21750 [bacterium]|nr:hypothetical protein [bacterium]